ncbi:MAG: serine hydrolase [Verrucomicrobia bacterium]|nr:serine hydrolase [Verrucomicrobiota bacterium]
MKSLAATSLLAFLWAVSVHGKDPELVWPDPDWPRVTPVEAGMDEAKLAQARDYALTGGGSGCIIRHGKQVFAWGDAKQLYDLKSSSKSFGVTVLGLALMDGKVKLDDPAKKFCPALGVPPDENAQTGWLDKITLRMLATQTAGFEKPGGFGKLLFEPGTKWHYSDGGPNWLADCLTLVYRRDLCELMFERVFSPIGIGRGDLRWRNNSYRPRLLDGIPRREFGSGISANVEAMSRFGYLYLREGRWENRELLPRNFVELARRTAPGIARLPVLESVERPGHFGGVASAHYGLLWWNNNDGTLADVPREAYWSWGLGDSLIVVIPSLDIVVARAGKSWKRAGGGDPYDVLKPFFGPICASAKTTAPPPQGGATLLSPRTTATATGVSPLLDATATSHQPSPVIREICWAPADTIIRKARGSDNWPMTWADDDALYTAYGDGNGFEPFTPEKLSLGLAKITGGPGDFIGVNLRSASIERKGDGKRGKKASGLLMVDGALYLLARNADNSQLAWSDDHGTTWTWSDWMCSESFGCPTFLNFGRNYAGARDGFVYVYSHDSDSAYERADRMVLARAPKDCLRDGDTYEFFERLDAVGQPVWTKDIAQRGAVLANPGRCYRSGVTYNALLHRYLWCVAMPVEDKRLAGGLAIYDAPEPWGPWTVAFTTNAWDVAPGESASFPTKWMSTDGRTLTLVFSGNDSFSIRNATLILKP